MNELGWFEPERYAPLALHAIRDMILPELRDIGVVLPERELEELLTPDT